MTSASLQIKESISTSSGLIGSFYSGKTTHGKAIGHCVTCSEELLPNAKFCGDCGTKTQFQYDKPSINSNLGTPYLNNQRAQVVGTPKFAQISPQMRRPISSELKQEYCKLTCLIARERAFLLLHYLVFLITNLIGFWCSLTAYSGLIADEMTRAVVACIPLFCINSVAFACLVPIKGTKREIGRLKERITYLHYQMEYANLA